MKLNLLPNTVSKQRQARTAIVASGLIVLVGIGVATGLTLFSAASLAQAKAEANAYKQDAADALALSQQADTIIASASGVIRNTNLAQAIISQSNRYPKLYDDLRPYIPRFFRVTRMTATPIDGKTASVTLDGVIDSYQQYADLVLALMRFPDAVSISRQGYSVNDPVVPPVSESDQAAKPRRLDQAPIPDNALDRLAYYQAQGTPPGGYLGVGNYGSGTNLTRGPMPDQQAIQIQMIVNRDLQAPDVNATLRSSGAPAGGAVGVPAGFPGAPGGFPGAPGGAPPGAPPSAGGSAEGE